MPRISNLLAALLIAFPLAAAAQNVCPCVPITHLWIVKSCPDWQCASTELLLANGDPQVMAVPVSVDETRWLVLRRVASGSAAADPAEPFQVESFEGMMDGAVRYLAIDQDHTPLLLTAPDGKVLVMSLKQPATRRRGVRP